MQKDRSSLEKAHNSGANLANESECQARKANQETKDALTNEIDQNSKNNAKMMSKPTSSKPQRFEPSMRNMSEFSTTSSRGFHIPTKNQGYGSGSSSRSDSLESTSAPIKPHTGGDVRWD